MRTLSNPQMEIYIYTFNIGVFFLSFQSSWVQHATWCHQVSIVKGEVSRWLVVGPSHHTTWHHALWYLGQRPRFHCWGWDFPAAGMLFCHREGRDQGPEIAAARGWWWGKRFHSSCKIGSLVSGFPVGYQHLAQQISSPHWGTVCFGNAK